MRLPRVRGGRARCLRLAEARPTGPGLPILAFVVDCGIHGVCAVVGAWGNIGAVAWGMMFKFGYIGNFEQGYIAMGYIIIASSVFTIFMRIKGQSSVLCGDQ